MLDKSMSDQVSHHSDAILDFVGPLTVGSGRYVFRAGMHVPDIESQISATSDAVAIRRFDLSAARAGVQFTDRKSHLKYVTQFVDDIISSVSISVGDLYLTEAALDGFIVEAKDIVDRSAQGTKLTVRIGEHYTNMTPWLEVSFV